MEALAVIHEQLRVGEGAEHEAELGADDAVGGFARVLGDEGRDVSGVGVAANAHDGAQPVGPAHPILEVERRAPLLDAVVQHGGEGLSTRRVEQADLDVVVAGLEADLGLHGQAEEVALEHAGDLAAGDGALVLSGGTDRR